MRTEVPVRVEPRREVLENCALVAVMLRGKSSDALRLVANGLDALQHRGEEGAGVAWSVDGGKIGALRGDGRRRQAVPDFELARIDGATAIIGHARYATSGSRQESDKQNNRQPFLFEGFAIAHNGNVPTIPTQHYSRETPTSDTYAIGERIAQEDTRLPFPDRISRVLQTLNGAYMLTFLTDDGQVYIASDPWGFKPGVVGMLPEDQGAMFASETIALDKAGAKYIQEIGRGGLYRLTPDGVEELWSDPRIHEVPPASCSFEPVYFQDRYSRAEDERSNRMIRQMLGRQLGRRWGLEQGAIEADFVIPVPFSGIDYAMGLAGDLDLPYEEAIGKNRYGGRNFIKPETPEERTHSALQSFGFDRRLIRGKRIIVVDDSIVRGFTTQGLIGALFEVGAAEITLVSGMPPVTDPCHWGIDMSKHEELLYHKLGGPADPDGFPQRVADWLAPEKPLTVRFQTLNDYVSVIQHLDPTKAHDVLSSGGCYHCVSGQVPLGVKIH